MKSIFSEKYNKKISKRKYIDLIPYEEIKKPLEIFKPLLKTNIDNKNLYVNYFDSLIKKTI